MSLESLPLPVLIFSMSGTLLSLIVGLWTGWYFLSAIIEGILERRKEMRRYDHDCAIITAHNIKYSDHENLQRNKQLQARILIGKYKFVTLSNSGYDKFFVMDSKDCGKLGYDITKWSREYEQESITFIPKNKFDSDRFFSYNDYQELKSKENELSNYYEVANILGKWSMTLTANKDWKDIQI